MVRGRAAGDRPTDAPRPDLDRRVVRFEVSPATYARLREAEDQLRREVDASLSDDEVLALLLDRALGAAEPGSRSARAVTLGVCVDCARTWQQAGGEQIEVGAEVAAAARCDGRVVAVDLERPLGGAHVGTVPAADHEAPHLDRASSALDLAWLDHLAQLHRTRETVSPKLREAVLHRDAGGCSVPGCRNAVFLEIHHVEPQARGGAHALDNLITLCWAHHRRVHEGRLKIRGTVGVDLAFEHTDGRAYGQLPAPPAPTAPPQPSQRAEARAALRALGLAAAEPDASLEAVEPDLEPAAAPEELVRAALRRRHRGTSVAREPAALGVYGTRPRAAARVPTWARRKGSRPGYGALGNAPMARSPSSSMP